MDNDIPSFDLDELLKMPAVYQVDDLSTPEELKSESAGKYDIRSHAPVRITMPCGVVVLQPKSQYSAARLLMETYEELKAYLPHEQEKLTSGRMRDVEKVKGKRGGGKGSKNKPYLSQTARVYILWRDKYRKLIDEGVMTRDAAGKEIIKRPEITLKYVTVMRRMLYWDKGWKIPRLEGDDE